MTYLFIWTEYDSDGAISNVSEREFRNFPTKADAKDVWESIHKPECKYSLVIEELV